jgi:WhiB family redox-sensing transcriptional regulator
VLSVVLRIVGWWICVVEFGYCAVVLPDDKYSPPPPPGDWRFDGACVGVGPEVFYPPSGQRPVEALALCAVCSVRSECLEYAIEFNQHWGVWGGLTERQRFALKRVRRQSALG